MALWRYAVGLLCLLEAVPTTALADVAPSSHDHRLLNGDNIKMRPPLAPFASFAPLAPLALAQLAVVRSVGANTTAPGTACTAEGEWNCLTTCWQRCASGRWSDTMALAPGTVCMPAGLSYDMQVVGDGPESASSESIRESETASLLSTVLSVTTGLCQCAVSSSTSCSSTTPSASSSTTNSAGESSSTPSGGEFVSGSSSAAGSGPASAVAVVVGVGTLAVVFARLLM